MSKLLYLLFSFLIILPASSYSALILRVKNKKALINLQGVKTQKGAFFKVYNLNNKKTGLLKIDRVSQTKAIGTLKIGAMSRKWNLEPVSKRTALVELKKAFEKKQKLALIQKEKMKRRIAKRKTLERKRRLAKKEYLEKRRQQLERRRLAAKKKSLKRKIASFSLEEDVLEGLDIEDGMEQSDEILSYSTNRESDFNENEPESSSFDRSSNYPEIETNRVKKNKSQAGYFDLGLHLSPQFNYMKVKSTNTDIPPYNMTGLGGSLHLHSLFSYNSFLEIGALLGYRYFSVSTPEGSCPRDEGCSLLVHYLSAMAHFKFNVLKFNRNTIWFLTEGSLMLPLAYLNRIPNLKEDAFESLSLHGTIGAGLGIDFKVGNWIIPVSMNGNLHMPLSQTTLLLTGGLQTGLRYQF